MQEHRKQVECENLPALVLKRLEALGIAHENFHHEPVFTVEQGRHLHDLIKGGHCRNLFLRDKKKNFYLIVAVESTKIDLKLAEKLMGAQGRFSFGNEEDLLRLLNVKPGSVNPFALMFDTGHQLRVFLDKHLFEYEQVNFHPMVNTQSTALKPDDLRRFIKECGHEPQVVDFSGMGY